jgi:photosystem II stability/assembly factor-like uncharacterized protein
MDFLLRRLCILLVIDALVLCGAHSQDRWVEIPVPYLYSSWPNPVIPAFSIRFVDSVHGCLFAGNYLLYTSDNGQSWQLDSIPLSLQLRNCEIVSDSVIWAYSNLVNDFSQLELLRSSDRGRTWSQVHLPDSVVAIGATAASDNLVRIISHTHLWVSTDRGESWVRRGQLVGSYQSINVPITFLDDSLGFVAGGYSGFAEQKTTDGGWTWKMMDMGQDYDGSFFYIEPSRCLDGRIITFRYLGVDDQSAQHYSGLVLSWNKMKDTVTFRTWGESYFRIPGFALDRWHMWIMKDLVLKRTCDGGATWVLDTLGLMTDILYDPFGHRFVSVNGKLLKLVSLTDAADIEPHIVRTYELSQNFPNPFNPSTTIRYGLPQRSQVTLTVFNTLGQQVAVLQNGEQEAGYHEVRLDGSGLSSGVYFYRMQAGSFVQTRKFILLR